jgi:hypothetical protein
VGAKLLASIFNPKWESVYRTISTLRVNIISDPAEFRAACELSLFVDPANPTVVEQQLAQNLCSESKL